VPKNAACETFGRSPGLAEFIGGRLAMPPDKLGITSAEAAIDIVAQYYAGSGAGAAGGAEAKIGLASPPRWAGATVTATETSGKSHEKLRLF
jgi:hypothetical protein